MKSELSIFLFMNFVSFSLHYYYLILSLFLLPLLWFLFQSFKFLMHLKVYFGISIFVRSFQNIQKQNSIMKLLHTQSKSNSVNNKILLYPLLLFLYIVFKISGEMFIHLPYLQKCCAHFNTPTFLIQENTQPSQPQVITTTLSCVSWQKEKDKAISDFQGITGP